MRNFWKSFKINYTPEFEKQLKRLSKRYKSLKNDLQQLILSLQNEPVRGQPLGYNCYKIRFAITSKGKGKSGGGRLITCLVVSEHEIFLINAYDKSEEESISIDDIKAIAKKYVSK